MHHHMPRHTLVPSPVGPITVVVDTDATVIGIYLAGQPHRPAASAIGPEADVGSDAVAQLREYFAGTRTVFTLRISPPGTEFQRTVWSELRRVRYGATITPASLAARLGIPGSAQIVADAVERTPVSIIIPSHRLLVENQWGPMGASPAVAASLRALERTGRQR